MTTRGAAVSVLLALVATPASADGPLRPFDARSPAAIRQQHAGRPFVLALWSITCEPCIREMPVWKAMRKRYPDVPVILVSTDPPSEAARVRAFLAKYDPGPVQRWQYADAFEERIRHAIDPAWRGELPRTYRYDAAHRREAVTGVEDPAAVERWFASVARKP